MRLTARTRKILHLVALPLAIACIATILSYRVVEQISSQASLIDVVDTQHANAMRGPAAPSPKIQLVTFDESTLRKMGLGDAHVMPRAKYADLVHLLDLAGTRVALFDVTFAEPDPGAPSPPGTEELKNALERLKNLRVTLSTTTEDNVDFDPHTPIVSGPMTKVEVSHDYESDKVRVASMDGETSHLGKIYIGAYPLEQDTVTGKRLFYGPISAALQYFGIPASSVQIDRGNGRVTADTLEWHIDESTAIQTRWTKTAAPFKKWDFLDAMAALKTSAGRKAFEGQIVIVGYRGAEQDNVETDPFGTIHGIDFVAQMVNTVLLGPSAQLARAPDPVLYGFAILICAAGFLATRAPKPFMSIAALGGLVGVCFLTQWWFACKVGWLLGVTSPILALSGTCLTALLIGRYWTDHVNLSMPEESEEATILFFDIRSSTVILHDIGRKEFSRVFADLMNRCGPIVRQSGGEIEHLLGDGFMAVFRRDGKRHHALRCADCCDRLIEATEAVAAQVGMPLKVALGFESGIVGGSYVNEGGKKGWSSTGTTIVLAQRLQALCGQFEIRVAVGPVARRLIADERTCEMITKAYVKGFDEEVEVCALCKNSCAKDPAIAAVAI